MKKNIKDLDYFKVTNKNIGYIYLIVQSKNISSEMISGIKASILLKETIEIEKGSYLFIKNLNNDKHKNSIVINTIQKIYDLLINKSVKVYIVDNKNNNYSGLSNSNNQIINLDELYNKLDFKYVTKLISKSNRLYFVVSYVDEETKLQNTHIFPTNYVSRELFERNHLLNSYNSSSNIFDLEIQENNKKEDLNTSISEVKQKEKNKSNSNNFKEYNKNECKKCKSLYQIRDKLIINFILLISFYISILYKF